MNLEFHKVSHELYNYVDDTIMILEHCLIVLNERCSSIFMQHLHFNDYLILLLFLTIINNDHAYSEIKDVKR